MVGTSKGCPRQHRQAQNTTGLAEIAREATRPGFVFSLIREFEQ
jgi:hypothetical protein